MAIELYRDKNHACFMLEDLVSKDASAIQSNQFIIEDSGKIALIDPGGNMTYNGIAMEKHRLFPRDKVKYLFASHADPDIIASLNKWLVQTQCILVISKLWARFVPHFCTKDLPSDRIISIPDEGRILPLGKSTIKAIPAHFLHSEGNFQFYDPVSKILFSGDMGASMDDHANLTQPVEDFSAHIKNMEGFHKRYMNSNKICRYWVTMVRGMDIEMIVPQHGRYFKGKKVINEFLSWVEHLECGVDLMKQSDYREPK
jgi:flavorubredoxin